MRYWLLLLCGCATGVDTGGVLPLVESVYECALPDNTVIEVCYDRGVSSLEAHLEADCAPTSRHVGWCQYCCGDCSRGCNAEQGCYCPEWL
jgi:hypothetical protein